MYCDKREVMTGDTAALMHLAHRSTGIRLGAAERSCEELDLFALQTSHIGTGEEPGQLVVSQHATVEVGDADRSVLSLIPGAASVTTVGC